MSEKAILRKNNKIKTLGKTPKRIRVRKYPVLICKQCSKYKSIIAKGFCQSCYTKKWRVDNKGYQSSYCKDWRKENPSYQSYNKEWTSKNPEKVRAESIARRKSIKKDYCEKCNIKGVSLDGHHPDYSRPEYIITLCLSCHTKKDKARIKLEAIK